MELKTKNRNSSCLRTYYLNGKSPWGFRIILDSEDQLRISKVRSNSKADLAGLKENDVILLLNDISAQKLSLHEASDLIESAHNLCLFVLTNCNQEASRITETNIRLDNMLVNDTNPGRNGGRIFAANPAFSKFQSPDGFRTNKDNLLLKEIEPQRVNYNSSSSIANYKDNHNSNLSNQNRARDKNYNLRRNYYSANESNGEEEYEQKKFNTKSMNRNYVQTKEDEEQKQVSYATITLRKPLKDLNYFSDTEAAFSRCSNTEQKFRVRNSSNSNRYQKITTTNPNTQHHQNQQQQQLQQKEKQQQQFIRSNSLNYNTTNNPNANNNINLYTETKYNTNNLNYNNTETFDNNNNNTQVPRSSVSSIRGMFNQASSVNNFNRQPHGFSKLSNFYGSKDPNQQSPPQQHQANQNQGYLNYNKPNVWSPPPVQPQVQQNVRHTDEPYEDPIEAKYEREMGSELAKSSSKANYSDSYFYNSSVHNYPTIDDQKKLAKTICETLEGSNPSSKYHLKKQKFQKQTSFENEGSHSAPYYSSGNEFFPSHDETQPSQPVNSYCYDEGLPDMIKRSIAQASMNDPVRSVIAPESFKSQHYTEHTTHTQMPPRAAMSLAAALQSNQSKGGRGAQIFQKRKEKSEKWIVDETNVKRVPGQPVLPKPQPQVFKARPEFFEPKPIPEHKLEQLSNQQNVKFPDFNSKPKGWGNNQQDPFDSVIDHLSHEINKEFEHKTESSLSPYEHNPNRIDLSSWNNMKNQQQSSNNQNYTISKDGIMNLKAKFYESSKNNEPKPFNLVAQHQPLRPRLSSHENHLFNNKNTQNVLKVSLGNNCKSSESPASTGNNMYSSGYYSDTNNMNSYYSNHDDDVAASDL